MDLAFRYPVLVQVVQRDKRDLFYGSVPAFGIETYELVDPGNVSQEYMFHLKLRRIVGEALTVCRAEGKDPPPILDLKDLERWFTLGGTASPSPLAANPPTKTVSVTVAADMLGVHPDTVRSLFDTGELKGLLSPGRQRTIFLTSVQEMLSRMKQRAELRVFEKKSKRKRLKRALNAEL